MFIEKMDGENWGNYGRLPSLREEILSGRQGVEYRLRDDISINM